MAPSVRRPGLLAVGLIAGLAAAGLTVLWRGAAGIGEDPGESSSPPLRLISLVPSVTECLFAIGAGSLLVGVTEACDFPPEAGALPRVGSFAQPNLERILRLRPTGVLTSPHAPPHAREILEKNGIRVIPIPQARLEDIPKTFELLGNLTGREAEGRALAREWRRRLSDFRSLRRFGPPKRVFLEIWHDPLTAPGRSSFLTEVIEAAGGISITADLDGEYIHVNPDHVVHAAPEVIVLTSMEAVPRAHEEIHRRVGWMDLPAVRNGKIVTDIDPSILLRPGPRLLEGIAALARSLRDE